VSGRTDVILLRHARRAARDPAAFVQTVAANLISAAVRLIPLGQTAGLRVLVALINLAGVADLRHRFPALDLILIESGGDNLAATFSPELADLTIYVIDVSAGDNPPEAWPRDHPQRSSRHQQDRPRPLCWRQPGRHGPGRQEDARRAPVRVHQHPRGYRRRGHRWIYRKTRRLDPSLTPDGIPQGPPLPIRPPPD